MVGRLLHDLLIVLIMLQSRYFRRDVEFSIVHAVDPSVSNVCFMKSSHSSISEEIKKRFTFTLPLEHNYVLHEYINYCRSTLIDVKCTADMYTSETLFTIQKDSTI